VWCFVSTTHKQQPVANDGTRCGGGDLGVGRGRRRLVGRRKAIGPRGWWAGMVEMKEKRDRASDVMGQKPRRL
jgi:hypothetical protein